MADPLADNPEEFDSPEEIRDFLRDRGHDPMDTETENQALFGNAILQGWENDEPDDRGGRTDAEVMLEWEMVAAELENEYGVTDVERPDVDANVDDWLEGP